MDCANPPLGRSSVGARTYRWFPAADRAAAPLGTNGTVAVGTRHRDQFCASALKFTATY
jgi:hypothetical protein